MKKLPIIIFFCSSQMFAQQTCERKPVDLQKSVPASIESINLKAETEKSESIGDKNTQTGKADPVEVLSLYPDPFSSSIHISITGNHVCIFKISDLTGRTVIIKEISGEAGHFDLSFLQAGVYYASVAGDDLLRSEILVKK